MTDEELAGGASLADARAAWDQFVRADDVLCVWGHHALAMLQRDELTLPERRIDVREVVRDHLKARSGSAEALVERLALPWRTAGRGRGGRRLGMLVAITRWLVAEARGSARRPPR